MEGGSERRHRRRHRVTKRRTTGTKRRTHRRRKSTSKVALKSKTVAELRKMCRSRGLPQSRGGKACTKSSLIRSLSGRKTHRKRYHRSRPGSR